MKLLVYGINYSPELTGIGKYTGEMCEWLAADGHDVEVITAMPYYPEWQVHPAYRKKWWFTEQVRGVKVRRSPFYVPKDVSGLTRMLHEFSFMLSSLVFWIGAFFRRYDAVMCIYPPLVVGFLPLLYKWIHGKPLIFHIQDLQVDAARDLGIIKNQRLLRTLEKVEGFFLRRANLITTISTGMRQKVIAKGISVRKTQLFPNWVNTELLAPMPDQQDWFKALFGYHSDQKVVLYSGNIGKKQGLDDMVDIAEKFYQEGNDQIQFLITGEGNDKERLQEMVTEKGLTNVRFGPLVPAKELPQLLNMADLHLILQRKGATDLVMPSKLGNILSCGQVPLIASEKDSTLRKLSEHFQFGINAEPEDQENIKQAITKYLLSDATQKKKNARRYADKHLGRESILHDFKSLLRQIIEHRRAAKVIAPRPAPAGMYKID